MLLKKRFTYISNNDLKLTGTEADNLASTRLSTKLDRTWPIEEIIISAEATIDNASLTNQAIFGILNLAKRITLEVNDGTQPRNVVNLTGPGSLIYAAHAGFNLSQATLSSIGAWRHNNLLTAGRYRVDYRIPFCPPQIQEPLRTRCLLPVHLYPQDPVLTIETASATDIDKTDADPLTDVYYEILLRRREMPKAVTDQILANGGFLSGDLAETQFALDGSLTDVEQRLPIPTPGEYTGLALYGIKGGANGTLDSIDATTSIGAETRWRIEAGGVVFQDFRWKHIKTQNEFSRPLVAMQFTEGDAAVTVQRLRAANFDGAEKTGKGVVDPGAIYLDFLTDEIHDASELGSLLDANIPANSGLKLELIGNVTTPAAAAVASSINMVGHRFFGDLAPYKAVRF